MQCRHCNAKMWYNENISKRSDNDLILSELNFNNEELRSEFLNIFSQMTCLFIVLTCLAYFPRVSLWNFKLLLKPEQSLCLQTNKQKFITKLFRMSIKIKVECFSYMHMEEQEKHLFGRHL